MTKFVIWSVNQRSKWNTAPEQRDQNIHFPNPKSRALHKAGPRWAADRITAAFYFILNCHYRQLTTFIRCKSINHLDATVICLTVQLAWTRTRRLPGRLGLGVLLSLLMLPPQTIVPVLLFQGQVSGWLAYFCSCLLLDESSWTVEVSVTCPLPQLLRLS